ncbi:hypothetical protein L1D55_05915 [Vibrio sp. Isolate22]|uniref:hypothetical protein n=1 Tax=Vibrio sp. Isolate22 TaxID=2908532 RepID=UPI001EFC5886|nr:hypothetical protein [Vibrio sp. Isolate22]MCG9691296.1 hypothetical protein [Vibrio sp. Isolate22]
MKFTGFLDALAEGEIEPSFVRNLITMLDEEYNYIKLGGRWCSVDEVLPEGSVAKNLLRKYAFYNLDPEYAFSSGNLKAQYIPDEDFINDGTAIIIFSLVGSQWLHTVRISNQIEMFNEFR